MTYIAIAKEKKIININFNASNYLKDLTNSVCMLIHEGLEYSFSHRSFQEYFAALYTVQLDDEQQKKFLTAWMKESNFRITTNYLDMLYDLQPARFIKNVLYPGLLEIKNFYEQNDKSNETLFSRIYSHIGVRPKGREKGSGCCYVTIKETYLAEVIRRICIVGKYDKSYDKSNKGKENDVYISKLLADNYGTKCKSVRFEKLISDGLFEEVMNKCWIVGRFEFAMEFLSNYDFLSIGRKKKLSSMLDEL